MRARTGATPGADATSSHRRYPSGPGWAAYRLPFPAAHEFLDSRTAGVAFEGEPAAGATPPAGGTAPAQPPAASSSATPPATGAADEPLGDGGKRALEAERQRARDAIARAEAAERERDELKAKTQTDHERELSEKAKNAAAERDAKWVPLVRQSLVREALRAAGMTNDKALALAVNAPEFASLKVTDEGSVDGLAEAVAAFKKDAPPELFTAPKPAVPQPTRGLVNGGQPERPKTLAEAVTASYAPPQG